MSEIYFHSCEIRPPEDVSFVKAETLFIGRPSVRTNPELAHAAPTCVARSICSQDIPILAHTVLGAR
jgi:hypothetical protein